jgi:hypothetical protein
MNRNEKHRKCGWLKRTLLIGLTLGLFSAPAVAQSFVYRVDPTPVMTTRGNVPAGGFPQLYVVPGATVTLCTDAACTIPATTFTNASGDTSCPTSAQVTLPGSPLCTSTAGPQGQFGFWIEPGTYYYQIRATTGTFGPYPISSPTVGTLGGPGIVSANNAGGLSPMTAALDCSRSTGASASLKLTACANTLPVSGGTVDGRNIQGAQTWNTDTFAAISVPVEFLCGATTYAVSTTSSLPSNVHLNAGSGCLFDVAAGITFTVNGPLDGTTLGRHFTGAGQVVISSTHVPIVYPQWWGATGDGVTDDYPAIQAAVDAVLLGGLLNTIQLAPVGVVYYLPGTYYITQPISTCHATGCPGDAGRGVPVGTMNACVVMRGDDLRGVSTLFTDKNIDMIQMYSWSCPSAVDHLYITGSATATGVRIRGNQTTVNHTWLLTSTGVLVEATATIDTTEARIEHNQCDSVGGGGGPVNCVVVTRTGGTHPAPQALHIIDLDCYGGNVCILADHLKFSVISDIHSDHPGEGIIQCAFCTDVAISNVESNGNDTVVQPNSFGLNVTSSTGMTVSNLIVSNFQAQAVTCQDSDLKISGYTFTDNVHNGSATNPADVFGSNCDLTLSNGTIANVNGHPASALLLAGSGPGGSYIVTNSLITGAAYTGTSVVVSAGAGGVRAAKFDNVELRGVNSTGGATPDFAIGAVIGQLALSHIHISHLVTPTNWLVSTYLFSNQCLDHNIIGGGALSLNSVSFNGNTDGCFNGANPITFAQFNQVAIVSRATVGQLWIAGGTTPIGDGYISLGTTTIGMLGAAAAHQGQMIWVSDSTMIAAEGQVCVGSGGFGALAVSNGTNWKCF